MGAILRPRRGTKAVADSKNFVLAKGEIFFEVPSGGVGKGLGRIKMGDGSTAYKNLPYFQELDLIAATGLDSTSKSTIRTNIGAGTSNLALGSTSSTAYRGDRGTTAYNHSQATHARTDATAVAASSTNGNIKINGTETTVYTHPGSGTNPHGTTKSDVGLGNVGNFKAVSTVASQGLSDTEKSNARANIGAGTSSLALGTTSSTAYRGDYGNTAYTHSQSTHARTDATAVAASSTNGKIKINGTETTVYTHPGSGTNPHGTTKSDVGLGNVGNFKAVSTVASQGLSDTEKSNARTNIAAASAADVTQLNNELAAATNDNQTTNTATKAIAKNQIFIWKGAVVQATAAIASGGTISTSNTRSGYSIIERISELINFRNNTTHDQQVSPQFIAGKWIDPDNITKTQIIANISDGGRHELYIDDGVMQYIRYDSSGGEVSRSEMIWNVSQAWYNMINGSTGGQPFLFNGDNSGSSDKSSLLLASRDLTNHQTNVSFDIEGIKILYKLNNTDQWTNKIYWNQFTTKHSFIKHKTADDGINIDTWNPGDDYVYCVLGGHYASEFTTGTFPASLTGGNYITVIQYGTGNNSWWKVQELVSFVNNGVTYRRYLNSSTGSGTWSAWKHKEELFVLTTTSWETVINNEYGSSYKFLGKCADYVGSTIASQTANNTVTNHFVAASTTGGQPCGATLTLVNSGQMSIFVQATDGKSAIFSVDGNGRRAQMLSGV